MHFSPKRLLAAVAAVAMTAAPVAASAAPAQAPHAATPRVAREGGPAAGDLGIAEGSTATLVSIGILAALIVIVLVATNGGGDNGDSPNSP